MLFYEKSFATPQNWNTYLEVHTEMLNLKFGYEKYHCFSSNNSVIATLSNLFFLMKENIWSYIINI